MITFFVKSSSLLVHLELRRVLRRLDMFNCPALNDGMADLISMSNRQNMIWLSTCMNDRLFGTTIMITASKNTSPSSKNATDGTIIYDGFSNQHS
mmetsp:Transcript_22481/g.21607  ORF Transcript_22481/g.21607 Transcript_22481/m.21607 type:complete len:95 (-) Transcript_22481:86-370(-)